MSVIPGEQALPPPGNGSQPLLNEIVMGLHWDPPDPAAAETATDLDALCMLFDAHGDVVEVIHPGQPRSADGAVVHTGDSRTGASVWDDERVFVFLDAVPSAVARLIFVVASASGQTFDRVAGALCHVSDALSETQWVRLDLTTLAGRTAHAVAAMRRGPGGWHFERVGLPDGALLLPLLRGLVGEAKPPFPSAAAKRL